MNENVLQEARQLISGFLKNRRNELGMSQDTLAELSGMGIATIRRFESGKFWINLKQYLLLCHHLKCYPFLAETDSEHPLAKDMRQYELWKKYKIELICYDCMSYPIDIDEDY